MTTALVLAVVAGWLLVVAGAMHRRGRRQHPGDRWSADVTSAHQMRAQVRRAMSSTSTNGRRPL